MAQDESVSADAVILKEKKDRTLLIAGNHLSLDLFDADTEIEGVSRKMLAEETQGLLQETITNYQYDRSLRSLLTKSAYALAAILIAAGLLFGFRKAFRSLDFVFMLYPLDARLGNLAFDLILHPLRKMGEGLLATIPDLVWRVILFFVTRYVLAMTRAFLRGIESGAVKLESFERDWDFPTYRIMRLVVVIFALVMAYPHIPGSDLQA